MQTILIVDDDRSIPEALAGGLEELGRELILCSDIESGSFRFEGLDFIADIKRSARDSRIIVMTGARVDGLEREVLERGAHAVQQKPFEISELETHLRLEPASAEPSVVRIPFMDACDCKRTARPELPGDPRGRPHGSARTVGVRDGVTGFSSGSPMASAA